MTQLTQAQRTILLDEVGEGSSTGGTAASQKMLRMRARRKLRAILERVSGLIVLRNGRVADWLSTMFASRDAIAQGAAACLACALVGTAVVTVTGPTAAQARTLSTGDMAGRLLVDAESVEHLALPESLKPAAERDGERSLAANLRRSRSASQGRASRLRPNGETSPGGLPLPPGSGDSPVPVPQPPEVPVPQPPSGDDPNRLPPLPAPPGSDEAPTMPLPRLSLRVHCL